MQHWLPYDEQRLYSLLGVDRGVTSGASCATTRARSPSSPSSAAGSRVRWRASSWRRGADAARPGPPGAAREARAAHADPGPPRAAPASSTRCTRRRSRTTRRRSSASRAARSGRRCGARSSARCRSAGSTGCRAGTRRSRRRRRCASTREQGRRAPGDPAAQARRLLSRQLRQLPRWLQQTRYNGPPPLVSPRSSPATASNYSNNAALSGDGREVVFESYQAKLAIAKRARRDRGAGARASARAHRPRSASGESADPRSNYNPALSADGRWVAFESALGNLNFAKRYGRMEVLARDLRSGRTIRVSHPPGLRVLALGLQPDDLRRRAADRLRGLRPPGRAGRRHPGRRARPPQRPRARGAGAAGVARRALRAAAVGRRPPRSPSAHSRARPARARRSSSATCAAAAARRVSAPGEEAWEPVLSARGTVVAYTAADAGGESHVVVRDLARGRATTIASPAGSGARVRAVAVEQRPPRRVRGAARAARARRRSSCTTWPRAATELVSRADGADGPPGMGSASHPAISGDGRRVAFTSEAWNLSPAEVQQRARGLRARPRPRDDAPGERGRRREPLPRPDQGVQHAERRVYHPPLRVIATPHDPG